jgi:Na+/proline symporter
MASFWFTIQEIFFSNQAAIVIVVYLLAMLTIGAWGLRLRGLEDFHLAGRSLRPVLLTGTFCATIVGASSTIGMAGLGFRSGLPGAWWMLSGTIGMLILSLFLLRRSDPRDVILCRNWWALIMVRG